MAETDTQVGEALAYVAGDRTKVMRGAYDGDANVIAILDEYDTLEKAVEFQEEELAGLREAAEFPTALAFLCPICAYAGVDEDQCCSSCGEDSYVVAKADAADIGRRLKSLGHLEDLLAAWVSLKRAGNRFMSAEERALYDAGMEIVAKRKADGGLRA